MELKQGDKVELRDGLNVYGVIEMHGAFALIQCIHFTGDEDLGDRITCTFSGELIWISTYHAGSFQDASYRPV